MEKFLNNNRRFIGGSVLEIGDTRYTTQFGNSIECSDVLDIRQTDKATIVGDLETGKNIPSGKYDCIILTQVIQFIFDLDSTMCNIVRALKVGGTCLVTVSGISPIWIDETYKEYWRFTTNSLQRLFLEYAESTGVYVQGYGNLATAKAFLDGYAVEDLDPTLFSNDDPQFQLLVVGRFTKTSSSMPHE